MSKTARSRYHSESDGYSSHSSGEESVSKKKKPQTPKIIDKVSSKKQPPSSASSEASASSSGELSDSGDEARKPAIRSAIVSLVKNSVSKASSASPEKDKKIDRERPPSPKRSRAISPHHLVEDDLPEWYRERSWSPDTRGRNNREPDRSHRDRDRPSDSYDNRRSDRRHPPEDRYGDRGDGRRDYRHEQRNLRDRREYQSRNDNRQRNTDLVREDKNQERPNNSRGKENSNVEDKESTKAVEEPVTKKSKEDTLTTKTGGAYIPPAKLRMMQQAITDKSSVEYQRMAWEALKKSINGLVNKVNVSNIKDIVVELLGENVVRGRGLLCRSIIQAQNASPTFTHVYAALVAVINSKFPQIGELLLRRLILQFRRGYKRNDKAVCLSSSTFLAHLVNQQVAHEVIALEVLTLLLENPTDDSVEIAVGFMKECGQKLTEVSPRGVNAIFERMRHVLHESQVDTRVQYMIEVMFQVRKDQFKDHAAIPDNLDLVEEDEQFTHLLSLDEVTSADDMLNVFKADPDYLENEQKYKELKKEIIEDSGSEEGGSEASGSGSESGSESEDEEQEAAKQAIVDQTETNLVGLRRTIYLTLQSSLDYEEAAHKMLKLNLKPGQEVELCNMILDCCAQQRTFEKFYGLLAQRFCMLDKKYTEPFEQMFMDQYETCHRLDPTKLRNVSKFFAHLLHTDSISWGVLQIVKMNEDDTTSSSRIFVKTLFLELAEYMGLPKLNGRLKDETLQAYFEGLLPKDHPKKTRFAINFFTSIGLGGLTDGLREHLKNAPKPVALQPAPPSNSSSSSSSSSDSSDSSDSDSSSSDSN